MKSKFTITEEDRECFKKALAGTEEITTKKIALHKSRPHKKNITPAKPEISREHKIIHDAPTKFHRGGLQTRLLRRFETGKLAIEARIDLHNLHQEQAALAVNEFIQSALTKNQKILLIIHGKGYRSENQLPVIKKWVLGYLYHHPSVLAYAPAPNQLGGSGATLIMLRNRNEQQ